MLPQAKKFVPPSLRPPTAPTREEIYRLTHDIIGGYTKDEIERLIVIHEHYLNFHYEPQNSDGGLIPDDGTDPLYYYQSNLSTILRMLRASQIRRSVAGTSFSGIANTNMTSQLLLDQREEDELEEELAEQLRNLRDSVSNNAIVSDEKEKLSRLIKAQKAVASCVSDSEIQSILAAVTEHEAALALEPNVADAVDGDGAPQVRMELFRSLLKFKHDQANQLRQIVQCFVMKVQDLAGVIEQLTLQLQQAGPRRKLHQRMRDYLPRGDGSTSGHTVLRSKGLNSSTTSRSSRTSQDRDSNGGAPVDSDDELEEGSEGGAVEALLDEIDFLRREQEYMYYRLYGPAATSAMRVRDTTPGAVSKDPGGAAILALDKEMALKTTIDEIYHRMMDTEVTKQLLSTAKGADMLRKLSDDAEVAKKMVEKCHAVLLKTVEPARAALKACGSLEQQLLEHHDGPTFGKKVEQAIVSRSVTMNEKRSTVGATIHSMNDELRELLKESSAQQMSKLIADVTAAKRATMHQATANTVVSARSATSPPTESNLPDGGGTAVEVDDNGVPSTAVAPPPSSLPLVPLEEEYVDGAIQTLNGALASTELVADRFIATLFSLVSQLDVDLREETVQRLLKSLRVLLPQWMEEAGNCLRSRVVHALCKNGNPTAAIVEQAEKDEVLASSAVMSLSTVGEHYDSFGLLERFQTLKETNEELQRMFALAKRTAQNGVLSRNRSSRGSNLFLEMNQAEALAVDGDSNYDGLMEDDEDGPDGAASRGSSAAAADPRRRNSRMTVTPAARSRTPSAVPCVDQSIQVSLDDVEQQEDDDDDEKDDTDTRHTLTAARRRKKAYADSDEAAAVASFAVRRKSSRVVSTRSRSQFNPETGEEELVPFEHSGSDDDDDGLEQEIDNDPDVVMMAHASSQTVILRTRHTGNQTELTGNQVGRVSRNSSAGGRGGGGGDSVRSWNSSGGGDGEGGDEEDVDLSVLTTAQLLTTLCGTELTDRIPVQGLRVIRLPTGTHAHSMFVVATISVHQAVLLWDRCPSSMPPMLEAYRALVRNETARFGGTELRSEDDSFLVAFPVALVRNALAWAVSLQIHSMALPYPTDLLQTAGESSVEIQNPFHVGYSRSMMTTMQQQQRGGEGMAQQRGGAMLDPSLALWRGFQLRIGLHVGSVLPSAAGGGPPLLPPLSPPPPVAPLANDAAAAASSADPSNKAPPSAATVVLLEADSIGGASISRVTEVTWRAPPGCILCTAEVKQRFAENGATGVAATDSFSFLPAEPLDTIPMEHWVVVPQAQKDSSGRRWTEAERILKARYLRQCTNAVGATMSRPRQQDSSVVLAREPPLLLTAPEANAASVAYHWRCCNIIQAGSADDAVVTIVGLQVESPDGAAFRALYAENVALQHSVHSAAKLVLSAARKAALPLGGVVFEGADEPGSSTEVQNHWSLMFAFSDPVYAVQFALQFAVTSMQLSYPSDVMTLPHCKDQYILGTLTWRGLRSRTVLHQAAVRRNELLVHRHSKKTLYFGESVALCNEGQLLVERCGWGDVVVSAELLNVISDELSTTLENPLVTPLPAMEPAAGDFTGFSVLPMLLKNRRRALEAAAVDTSLSIPTSLFPLGHFALARQRALCRESVYQNNTEALTVASRHASLALHPPSSGVVHTIVSVVLFKDLFEQLQLAQEEAEERGTPYLLPSDEKRQEDLLRTMQVIVHTLRSELLPKYNCIDTGDPIRPSQWDPRVLGPLPSTSGTDNYNTAAGSATMINGQSLPTFSIVFSTMRDAVHCSLQIQKLVATHPKILASLSEWVMVLYHRLVRNNEAAMRAFLGGEGVRVGVVLHTGAVVSVVSNYGRCYEYVSPALTHAVLTAQNSTACRGGDIVLTDHAVSQLLREEKEATLLDEETEGRSKQELDPWNPILTHSSNNNSCSKVQEGEGTATGVTQVQLTPHVHIAEMGSLPMLGDSVGELKLYSVQPTSFVDRRQFLMRYASSSSSTEQSSLAVPGPEDPATTLNQAIDEVLRDERDVTLRPSSLLKHTSIDHVATLHRFAESSSSSEVQRLKDPPPGTGEEERQLPMVAAERAGDAAVNAYRASWSVAKKAGRILGYPAPCDIDPVAADAQLREALRQLHYAEDERELQRSGLLLKFSPRSQAQTPTASQQQQPLLLPFEKALLAFHRETASLLHRTTAMLQEALTALGCHMEKPLRLHRSMQSAIVIPPNDDQAGDSMLYRKTDVGPGTVRSIASGNSRPPSNQAAQRPLSKHTVGTDPRPNSRMARLGGASSVSPQDDSGFGGGGGPQRSYHQGGLFRAGEGTVVAERLRERRIVELEQRVEMLEEELEAKARDRNPVLLALRQSAASGMPPPSPLPMIQQRGSMILAALQQQQHETSASLLPPTSLSPVDPSHAVDQSTRGSTPTVWAKRGLSPALGTSRIPLSGTGSQPGGAVASSKLPSEPIDFSHTINPSHNMMYHPLPIAASATTTTTAMDRVPQSELQRDVLPRGATSSFGAPRPLPRGRGEHWRRHGPLQPLQGSFFTEDASGNGMASLTLMGESTSRLPPDVTALFAPSPFTSSDRHAEKRQVSRQARQPPPQRPHSVSEGTAHLPQEGEAHSNSHLLNRASDPPLSAGAAAAEEGEGRHTISSRLSEKVQNFGSAVGVSRAQSVPVGETEDP